MLAILAPSSPRVINLLLRHPLLGLLGLLGMDVEFLDAFTSLVPISVLLPSKTFSVSLLIRPLVTSSTAS